MDLDALLLSRLQFAFTIGFHILFPTLTIGLAIFLAVLEGFWLKTQNKLYLQHYKFWAKIFALAFGMGVVSGVVLSYEVGTNFSRFSNATGNVLGPLFSYEVLTAFFLEAGFLGIMLFGWNRVGPRLHFLATILVAIGTSLSAFWILSANSWMQTPSGFTLQDGKFMVESWWEVIFNPSFPYRLAHMLVACYLTSAFVIAGISAWYLLKQRHVEFARRSFLMALVAAFFLSPLQIFIGDLHGLNTLQHQPIKVAAMEGLWETTRGAPLLLFAVPNMQQERNYLEVAIPRAGSLILTHDFNGEVKGLKEVTPQDRPNVPIVFYSFRIMVGIGLIFLAMVLMAAYLKWRGVLFDKPWFFRICIATAPLGFVAVIAGWVVAEVGRQPWTVYGLLRTADAASLLPAGNVLSSLIAFFAIYNVVFIAFLYFVFYVIRSGPSLGIDEAMQTSAPARPAFMPTKE